MAFFRVTLVHGTGHREVEFEHDYKGEDNLRQYIYTHLTDSTETIKRVVRIDKEKT